MKWNSKTIIKLWYHPPSYDIHQQSPSVCGKKVQMWKEYTQATKYYSTVCTTLCSVWRLRVFILCRAQISTHTHTLASSASWSISPSYQPICACVSSSYSFSIGGGTPVCFVLRFCEHTYAYHTYLYTYIYLHMIRKYIMVRYKHDSDLTTNLYLQVLGYVCIQKHFLHVCVRVCLNILGGWKHDCGINDTPCVKSSPVVSEEFKRTEAYHGRTQLLVRSS